LRFFYFAHCYRRVRPARGQSRELLQAGIELVGAPAPEGTVEALTVLCRALEGAGLKDFRVGLGDASLFGTLMERLDVAAKLRELLLNALVQRDFVALDGLLREADLPASARETLLSVPQTRGGPEVLDHTRGPIADAVAGMHEVAQRLPSDVASRVIFDLGLLRSIGYYTGAVFEVYDPALGAPLGGGGRYDELLGRFGRALPAVGFALSVERLHIALAGEERGTGAMLT
jgi:ATP phosphoribosyltransferase regulatory subunit